MKLSKKQQEMMQKKEDLEFIKQFREISIKNVCSDLHIDYSNIMNGNASCKKIRRVRKEMEYRLNALLHRYD